MCFTSPAFLRPWHHTISSTTGHVLTICQSLVSGVAYRLKRIPVVPRIRLDISHRLTRDTIQLTLVSLRASSYPLTWLCLLLTRPLSLSLSSSLPLSLSPSLSSLSLPLPLSLSLSPYLPLSPSLSLFLPLSLSPSISFCMSVSSAAGSCRAFHLLARVLASPSSG